MAKSMMEQLAEIGTQGVVVLGMLEPEEMPEVGAALLRVFP